MTPPALAPLPASEPRAPAALADLVAGARACRRCVLAPWGAPLPHAPNPVLRLTPTARVLVASQAPGARAHASGVPFSDASGARLRAWMAVDEAAFYDAARVAIVPMGFCFPGYDAKGSDIPPRRECAATWHDALFAAAPPFAVTLLIGAHAQAYHLARLGLGEHRGPRLGDTVAGWRAARAGALARGLGAVYVLPHPSWRNTGWLKRNPLFEGEVLPALRADVARALAGA